MDTRLRLGLIAIALLVLAACSLPSEAETLERLAASEAAVDEMVAAALGADVVTEWERDRPLPFACESLISNLELAGSYPEEVLDRLAAAAATADAKVQPITRFHGGLEWKLLNVHFRFSWDGPDRIGGTVYWDPDTGAVSVQILSGCFRT